MEVQNEDDIRKKKALEAENEKEKEKRNWTWLTARTAGFVILLTFLLGYAFYYLQRKIDQSKIYQSVYWSNKDSTLLISGPPWFLYDSKIDSLKSLKAISESEKIIIRSLVDQKTKNYNSYVQAIDLLSFKSNNENNNSYYLILLFGGVCAAIGVQLRTINNFVGVTCYKGDFNFKVWWPWYIMRPLLGSLIGPILFILVDGRFISSVNEASYSRFSIGLAILAGFGSEDFLEMLRSSSKRIFSTKKNNN